MTGVPSEDQPVVLTASPLQRIGAFALAGLVGVDHPRRLSAVAFREAVNLMTEHLLATVKVAKPGNPGGFWLSASYMLWPNSKLNPTARGKQSSAQREELIREWRAMPDESGWPQVPCAYCGRAACEWFGKVDIPLGASVAHRNTTAPGQEGTPLCYPCVACLWAFPYGARLSGGRAAAIHSWDEPFLNKMTAYRVSKTLTEAGAPMAKGIKSSPYERELAVLDAVRHYADRITAGVELIVLSNSNKEQVIATQEMAQPVAEWLRSTVRVTERRSGYGALVAAQATKQVPGEAFLAKRAFARPAQVLDFTVGHLLAQVAAVPLVPEQTRALVPLIFSYCCEVLNMDDKDVERVKDLSRRLALLLGQDSRPGPFRDFIRANSRGGNLQSWFRTKSVEWLVLPLPKEAPADQSRVLLPVQVYRLLFEDENAWSWRRLLVFAVLESLAEAGWEPKGSKEELQEISDAATTADTTEA